jgi:hypothetical protein
MTSVGFEEDFALSFDRKAVLSKLAPNSEDWFFFTILEKLESNL